MDMEQACKQLKAGKVVRFWYCAGDGAGNPLLMLDKKRIPIKDVKEAKKSARKKQFCGGHMVLKKGVLTAFTDDGAPNLFDKSVKLLVGNYIQRPREVEVKEAAAADGLLEAEASDTGAQSLGKEYQGESEAHGWRAELVSDDKLAPTLRRLVSDAKQAPILAEASGIAEEQLGQWVEDHAGDAKALRGLLAKAKHAMTKYFDDQEKRRATAGVDEHGRLVESNGLGLDGKRGFAIDAESGDVRTFTPRREKDKEGVTRMTHHSSPVRGKDVVSAGHIEASQGRVTKIDDQSGHFKPDATKTLQALRHLEQMGVQMVDDRLVDASGRPVNERTLPKGLKERAKWMKAYEKALELVNKERQSRGEKPQAPSKEYQAVRKELMAAKVWFSNKSTSVELLGKTGVSESEWDGVKGNVKKINALLEEKLGVADMLPASTSAAMLNSRPALNQYIGQLTSRTLSKEQFEQTGGNETQIRAKDAMQTELLEKTTKVKAAASNKRPAPANTGSYAEVSEDVLGEDETSRPAAQASPVIDSYTTSAQAVAPSAGPTRLASSAPAADSPPEVIRYETDEEEESLDEAAPVEAASYMNED